MKIVHLSYQYSSQKDPDHWIRSYEYFYGIWEHLAQSNEIIFLDFIDYEGRIKHNGVFHWFLKKSAYSRKLPLGLHWLVRGLKPDVVMVHGIMSPLQVCLLRLQLGSRPRIVLQHHAEQAFRHSLKKALQRRADRATNAYLFTGKDHAVPWLKSGLISNAEKVKEVMEVTSTFQPQDKATARAGLFEKRLLQADGAAEAGAGFDGLIYLWIGHLNENKNPLLAVSAFMRFLTATNANAHLCMIFQSNGLLEGIKDLLSSQPDVAGRIHLIGKVPHEDLGLWCSAADFIVSTSFYEGSGVAVCEGMSCGCIPILSDIASFRFMTGGQRGILFEAGNEEALVAAFVQSISINRIEEQQKTLQQYHRHLSASAIALRLQEVLSSL